MTPAAWHLLLVRPQAEMAVERRLTVEAGIKAFVPVRSVLRHPSRRSRSWRVEKVRRTYPAIPGYVLALLPWPINWHRWLADTSPHIRGVLAVNGEPRALRPAEVEQLHGCCEVEPDEYAVMETHYEYSPGDVVQVVGGPLYGQTGAVQEIRGGDARLLLRLLGGDVQATIPAHNLAKAG